MEHQNTSDQQNSSMNFEDDEFDQLSSDISISHMALTSPNDNLTPKQIISLQRTHGNQFVQRLIQRQVTNPQRNKPLTSLRMITPVDQSIASSQPEIQRQNESGDTDEDGERTIRMLIASGMHDEIGHTWVIFEHSNGDRETWGFYPTDFEGMGSSYGNAVTGLVVNPDPHHDDEPTTTYGHMINHEQYQRAIEYANNHRGHEYRLRGYNCTAFARGMLHAATGDSGPSISLFGRNNTPLGLAGATFVEYLQRLF